MDDGVDGPDPMRIVVELAPAVGGSQITQTMTFPSVEMCQGALQFGADRLGQTTLAKLEAAALKL